MAKTLNSVSFALLLLVLVMASTGIFKCEALPGVECTAGSGCLSPASRVFLGECGPEPFPGTDPTRDVACCDCCKATYGSPPVCWAVVEGSDNHCHCYKKR